MTDLERWQPGVPTPGIAGDPASLSEVYEAAREQQVNVDNLFARSRLGEEAYDRRIDAIEKATGQRLTNPYRRGSTMDGMTGQPVPDYFEEFDNELRDLALSQPKHRDVIQPERSPKRDAADKAKAAGQRFDEVADTRGNLITDPAAFGAMFGGQFVGAMEDPANFAANFVGPAGNKAKSILWNAVRQGAVNAAVQAALEPAVQSWRKEAGLEAGLLPAAQNVGMAFAFGAGLDAGGRTIARTGRSLTGRADGQGGFLTDAPAAPVTSTEAALDALEQAAKARPEGDILRRAAEGDDKALVELARGLKDDDPAVRGAIAEIEAAPDARLDRVIEQMGIDDGSHIAALAQAVRNAEVPFAEPPAPRVDGLPPAKGPSLSSDDPAPAARGVSFEVDGKPAQLDRVEAGDIGTDAATFQYKSGGDAAGATDRLANVGRWDEIGAGKVVVFERMNGELVIADGHQRLALAKRLEREGKGRIELDAYVLREADGWTPADVRAAAAKKNLQEGSGTAIDAARILRERPDIADQSLPTTAPMLRQARALARLSDAAFARVVSGQAEPSYAALVADLVPDRNRHASILDDLTRLGPETQREARVAIGELLQAGTAVETQLTLLGAENSVRSLLPERIKVLDQSLALLRQENRVFTALVREAGLIEAAGNRLSGDVNAARAAAAGEAEALIERLARTRGPVSALLDELAGAVAAGKSVKEAARNFVARFQAMLDDRGLAALLSDDATPRPPTNAWDEPLGDGAKEQTDRLAASWKEADKATKELDKDLEQMGLFSKLVPSGRKRLRGQKIEQTWGPKWDVIMGQQYRMAEAGGDLSTQYDILKAKLSKASGIEPEMRAAMEAKAQELYDEMGPEGRRMAGIAEDLKFKLGDGAPRITAGDLHADGFPKLAEALVRHEVGLMAHLLPEGVRVNVLRPGMSGIADRIEGAWQANTATLHIALAALDKGATVRHELVHAYRSLGLLTDQEFRVLRSKVDEVMDADTQALIDKEYRAAYGSRGWHAAKMADAIDEEKVAYLVEERWRRKVSFGKTVDAVLDRIIEVMERMQNALAGLGYQSFEDVIARIESGEVAARSRMRDLTDADLAVAKLDREGGMLVESCKLN